MKHILILLALLFISCAQTTKEKKSTSPKKENVSLEKEEITNNIVMEEFDFIDFNDEFKKLPLKKVPFIDNTNFDSFIDEDDIKPINAKAFSLPKIYENWYEEAYNFKTISGYKLDISINYLTAVITVKKGDNEMESRLINYTTEGTVIDSKVIAFDEIAEGWSRVISRIGKSYITIDNIFWSEEKDVTQTTYSINDDGTFEEINSERLKESVDNYALVNNILLALKLEWAQIELDYLVVGELSQETNETLVIIPVIAQEDNDLLRINTHMVLVNSITGKISHQLFETYNENGWQSDAIAIEDVALDSLAYLVKESEKSFGIRIKYQSGSQPNPYSKEVVSLYIKEEDILKKIFDNYTIYESIGEVNVNTCYSKYNITENTFAISDTKTGDFFNIKVQTINTQRIYTENDNGECKPEDRVISKKQTLLKYNGSQYAKFDFKRKE